MYDDWDDTRCRLILWDDFELSLVWHRDSYAGRTTVEAAVLRDDNLYPSASWVRGWCAQAEIAEVLAIRELETWEARAEALAGWVTEGRWDGEEGL